MDAAPDETPPRASHRAPPKLAQRRHHRRRQRQELHQVWRLVAVLNYIT